MAKKTKEQIYEWITSQNWFRFYEDYIITHPSRNFIDSKATCFKEYLDWAWDVYKKKNEYRFVEFICSGFSCSSPLKNDGVMYNYFSALDYEYWNCFHNK